MTDLNRPVWLYNDTEVFGVPEGYVGFVYLITRKSDGKRYIGQKGFHARVTRPPLKGMKQVRRSLKESDWQDYYGSSSELLADIGVIGRGGFRREILHLCKSKSEMTYLEAKEIFAADAVLRDDYYNGWVKATCRQSALIGLRKDYKNR